MDRHVALLCWGTLFHFLGRDDEAEPLLRRVCAQTEEGTYASIAAGILDYCGKRPTNPSAAQQTLEALEQLLTERVFRGSLAGVGWLSRECRRAEPKEALKQTEARDDPHGDGGYSRDPFKPAPQDPQGSASTVYGNITLGSILYLLRAYATIFRLDHEARDFNQAKRALNDCFQAFAFAWRVYQHSMICHHCPTRSGRRGFEALASLVIADVADIAGVRQKSNALGDYSPEMSPFFLWALFVLIDVMRGNIYYQMDHFDSAATFYETALKLVRKVDRRIVELSRQVPTADQERYTEQIRGFIVPPTLVAARLERSKIRVDRGHYLGALIDQLECLRRLVSAATIQKKKLARLVAKLDAAIEFLLVEKDAPVWDKRILAFMFGFGTDVCLEKQDGHDPGSAGDRDAQHSQCIVTDAMKNLCEARLWDSEQVIRGEDIEEAVEPAVAVLHSQSQVNQHILAEVLARIGFTLLVLRAVRDRWFFRSGVLAEWLRPYLTPKGIRPEHRSAMARYCLSILSGSAPEQIGAAFGRSVDRQLALRLREAITRAREHFQDDQPGQAEADEYEWEQGSEYIDLLDATTHHIRNLVTIPRHNQRLLMRHGYLNRRRSERPTRTGEGETADGDRAPETVEPGDSRYRPEDKFVVLRRWQSYNPKLPRPDSHRLRGGGYLLIWHGRGIVIDPGYNFIQNLYDEGFSLEDIHAVIVSHSHPDHDDDLSTLLTMLHEWREYRLRNGIAHGDEGRIDLFLNESCYRKFGSWLHSRQIKLGRIVPLPLVVWDRDSTQPVIPNGAGRRVGPRRGKNTVIDLTGPDGYDMRIEIVPSWHHDVISSTCATGFIFHLCSGGEAVGKEPCVVCRVGYTGDSGAYGLQERQPVPGNIGEQYRTCDVLVAHLGDARLRELATGLRAARPQRSSRQLDLIPVATVLRDWFCRRGRDGSWRLASDLVTEARVNGFLHMLTALHLIDDALYEKPFAQHGSLPDDLRDPPVLLARKWARLAAHGEAPRVPWTELVEGALDYVQSFAALGASVHDVLRGQEIVADCMADVGGRDWPDDPACAVEQFEPAGVVYIMLGILCASCRVPWIYQHHLGVRGIEKLFSQMFEYRWQQSAGAPSRNQAVLVVGELPEELSSYRHRIARWLNTRINRREVRRRKAEAPKGEARRTRPVTAFTGDVGLHIRLALEEQRDIRVRCDYCNLNNEIAHDHMAYHEPDRIRETVLNALDSRMIYLCQEKDHHPEHYENSYIVHLFRPEVKRI